MANLSKVKIFPSIGIARVATARSGIWDLSCRFPRLRRLPQAVRSKTPNAVSSDKPSDSGFGAFSTTAPIAS